MTNDTSHNNPPPNQGSRTASPPMSPHLPTTRQNEAVSEADALVELLRKECLHHIDAAWRAQRRLMQACLKPDNNARGEIHFMDSSDQRDLDEEEISVKNMNEWQHGESVQARDEASGKNHGGETSGISHDLGND